MKNTITFCFFLTIVFFLILPLYAGAQGTAPSPEEEFFADIPVVLTATRLAQPATEAPASITIIDRQMIEATGARDIVDVFRLVPGFQVQHENGHTPIVSYHGMSDQFSRWMQVLVDGRTVYTPSFGGVEWSQIPLVLDEIERIEVIRGPNAASYGSNAFAATINIITKHSSDTNGTFARFTASNSNDIRDAIFQFGDNINVSAGNLDYRIMLGRLTDDGYDDRNDVMRANLARFRMDYNDGDSNSWLYEMGINNGPRGLDDGNNYDNPERNYEKDTENNFLHLRWTHNLSENEEVYIQYFNNNHKVDETFKYFLTANEFDFLNVFTPAQILAYNADPVSQALYNSLKTQRHDLEIQHTFVPSELWRVVWGGSIRRDQYDAPGLLTPDNEVSTDLLKVFANTEWKSSDKFTVNAGAMWEDSELTGVSFSPKLGLVFHANKNNNIRIIASKATRIPSMIEYDGEIIYTFAGPNLTNFYGGFGVTDPYFDSYLVSTNDIDNESIVSFEIGLNSHHPGIGISTDIKLYQDKITDILYFAETPDPVETLVSPLAATPKNGGEVTIRGLELQADVKPFPGNRIVFAYSITDIVNDKVLTDTTDSDFVDTTSKESFSILFSQRFRNNVTASLIMYKVGTYEGLQTGNPTGGYSQTDIRVAYPFEKNKFKGEIAFVSKNISGEEIFDWDEENHYTRTNLITITGQFD